ncbi:glycosyltransferase [Sneathiella chinensis]|uniref:Spore protein YkvP/CgeB glycosyl transferase-like domain-containing protein n=1 Tax=Sneathiella chinensis TaxID=349750 RepID=A0ABQ5U904_9PROT|nr:glycosyltransferase [Sneathiella chinensis]GLQ07896.1 hypothetical protein GCM10007924_31180 [Sneathiella chinensis]
MSKLLMVSARDVFSDFADCCAFELEDTIHEALDADFLLLGKQHFSPSSTNLNKNGFNNRKEYDAVFIVTNNFRKLAITIQMMEKLGIQAKQTAAYVFGAYVHDLQYFHLPAAKHLLPRYTALKKVDHFFGPIPETLSALSNMLDRPFHYSPIAVDVLNVAHEGQERWISVNGFGRQEPGVNNLLADTMNRPGSPHVYFHTNSMVSAGLLDWKRYREQFWHLLRMSRLSLTFDALFYNPGNRAKHSFVGPRWYESLATGTVVIGQAPKTDEAKALLDWDNATVDLPENPAKAVDYILGMLSAPEELDRIGQENIRQMRQRHDWRYRIKDMLESLEIEQPGILQEQIAMLRRQAPLAHPQAANQAYP